MDKLRTAEGYIQQLETRCEDYLTEIDRLRNNIPLVAQSRTTIEGYKQHGNNIEVEVEGTPIRKIQ